jgi:hypothetical protein
LNIGPFYVDSQGDVGAARDDLNQLEQLRWVLGGLLESKDLPSRWPIRVMLTTKNEGTKPGHFVWQNGQYLLAAPPGSPIPLDQVAGIFLEANTSRLPPEAESGLRDLLGTIEAHGSHVTWGKAIPRPDLGWARMQLFATKFEYTLSFHIFVSALKNGSSLRVAERNAFGKDPAVLEKEAAANLASGNWQTVTVSGRPLDPKRDFGQHSVDDAAVATYLADAGFSADPKAAEAAYKSAVEAGGTAMALGYAGLAQLAKHDGQDPRRFLEDAIRAGSSSALVYLDAAEGKPPDEAVPLLKRAALLNPLWGEPAYREAQLAPDPAQKEVLLKKAAQLEPRNTRYWVELAELQAANGHAVAAQGSWLRAEDSAPNDAERNRVHELRMSKEQERLDAADAERTREREAAHLENQRAQDAEAARIREAEEKANRALDEAAGARPQNVVPWDATVPSKKISGTLTSVECLRNGARISVNDQNGNTVRLLLSDPSQVGLPCGSRAPRPVSISYAAEPDEGLHTAGRVLSIQMQ